MQIGTSGCNAHMNVYISAKDLKLSGVRCSKSLEMTVSWDNIYIFGSQIHILNSIIVAGKSPPCGGIGIPSRAG